ncbi:MAG: hypothetical protein ABI609_15715 [Acidobacteriota bacterium]
MRPFLLLALIASVVACAKHPGPAASSAGLAPIDACELLTLDEADPQGADLLMPVGNAVDHSIGADSAKCAYGTSDLPIQVVGMEVRRFADADAAKSAQSSAAGALRGMAGGDLHSVEGLADGAVWAGGRLNQLHVLAGSTRLIVTVEVGDVARREGRARELARLALGRLSQPAKPAP